MAAAHGEPRQADRLPVVVIDHGVHGKVALERSVLEPLGFEVIDTRGEGRDVEAGFQLALERGAVGLLVGPILPVDRGRLERLRDAGCRAVVRYGVGLDNVDVAAAGEIGIEVGNVPEYGHEEISNHAIALMLALHRRLFHFDRGVRAGGEGIPGPEVLPRLSTQTLGLIGLGRIGQRVASKAAAFELRVIGVDPYLSEHDARAIGVELVDLETLLREADCVSLHVPLTAETRHMIDHRALALMKPDAMLINIGRGGLIDEAALVRALHDGTIAGAALDVTEVEPLPLDSPLHQAPNVILTPHVAWVSRAALEELRRRTAEAVARLIAAAGPVAAERAPR
jgi:D-3-phosphoglycerate dehydrogenase / 2-oxoglutarate reductase